MDDENTRRSFYVDPPVVAAPQALPDRRDLALVAFERTQMAMVVTDPRQRDNPIVLANQAFLDLTGYSADEVIGRNCRFLQGPLTAQHEVDEIRAALAEHRHVLVELLNYKKGGTAFWNQLLLSAVTDEHGELLYYFGSQQDVTARRRAADLERVERLLLMEVDHRALNALTLVESIVSLSQADDPSAYAASVRGRVGALASAHRLLAKHRWSGVAFSELMQAVVLTDPQTRFQASGDDVILVPQSVQPLALVLHELRMNAEAHGALAGPNGTVAVHWRTSLGQLVVQWQETLRDGSRSRPDAGFGLSIITGVTERQLGGTATLDWVESGLMAELIVPLTRSNRTVAQEVC